MKKEDHSIDRIVRELERELDLFDDAVKTKLPVIYEDEQLGLVTSKKRKVIGGVFGGLADYFMLTDFSLFMMRIIAVLAVLLGFGSPIILYLVAWILMPKNNKREDEQRL